MQYSCQVLFLDMGKNPKFLVRVRFGFLHLFTFGFGFGSVLGKTRVLVRFVLAEFGYFPISSYLIIPVGIYHIFIDVVRFLHSVVDLGWYPVV